MNSNKLISKPQLDEVFNAVFRNSTKQAGFFYCDFGTNIESLAFRNIMVELKEKLSEICNVRLQKNLTYQALGRFNQQYTSRFHRDSAGEHTFLMLGYEPTKVESSVFIADYTKYLESCNSSIQTFFGELEDLNCVENHYIPDAFITKLTPFPKNHYRLLLLDNSKSFKEKTFGVFHRGEILKRLENEDRILNYMMLNLNDNNVTEQFDNNNIFEFLHTDMINR